MQNRPRTHEDRSRTDPESTANKPQNRSQSGHPDRTPNCTPDRPPKFGSTPDSAPDRADLRPDVCRIRAGFGQVWPGFDPTPGRYVADAGELCGPQRAQPLPAAGELGRAMARSVSARHAGKGLSCSSNSAYVETTRGESSANFRPMSARIGTSNRRTSNRHPVVIPKPAPSRHLKSAPRCDPQAGPKLTPMIPNGPESTRNRDGPESSLNSTLQFDLISTLDRPRTTRNSSPS